MRMKRQNKKVADVVNYSPPKGPFPTPELVEEVKPEEDDIVFEKFCPSAFTGTCFDWWLRKYSIKTIILTGVNVATGINGTAREAINLGYYAVVVRDCVEPVQKRITISRWLQWSRCWTYLIQMRLLTHG